MARIPTETYRHTLGMFATGVTVVAAAFDDVLHGMTANAFTSVSLDPPLVLVCVDRRAGCHDFLCQAKVFAVTVLAADQERESTWFASKRRPHGRDQFDEVSWWPAPVTGSPVLSGGIAWMDCRLTEVHEGGDHSIFLGEVVELGRQREADPLIFFEGRYRSIAPG